MRQLVDADLRLLRVFVTVVDCGGFSAAQTELNVSPSTISIHMAALEQRLGVKLCHRGRVGFRLTEKGEAVYEAAQRLFAAAESFRADAAALRGRLTGELNFGLVDCTVTDAAAPVHDAIRRFNLRDNTVHLNLRIEAPQELERCVLDGRLHAAIGSFPREVAGIVHAPLYEEAQLFYCGRGHPLFERPDDRIALADIRQSRVVARGYWKNMDIDRLGIATAAATVYHMEAQAILILSGGYLGFLPKHYADGWVARGDLRPLLSDRLAYGAKFDLITRKGRPQSLVLATFIDDLQAAFAARRPTDAPAPPVEAAIGR